MLSKKLLVVCLAVLGCCELGVPAQAETVYHLVKGLSLKSNPHSVWSYLYASNLLPRAINAVGGVKGWIGWAKLPGVPDDTLVARNETGATIHYLTIVDPVNYLEMDPESWANVAVRFTAPTPGKYYITGNFVGIDTGENAHPVQIDRNGAAVFSKTISTYGQTEAYDLHLTLAAGDVVDFLTLTGGSHENLSTGLQARLSGP